MVAAVAAIAALFLALFPVVHHLCFGLKERRREIIDLFNDDAIRLYFQHFYKARAAELSKAPARELGKIYDARFGLRSYLLPLTVYTLTLALTVFVCAWTAAGENVLIRLPEVPIAPAGAYALAGAYLWVVNDLIARYRQRNLVPSSLYTAAFRMIIAIPLATAIAGLLKEPVAPTIGFLLGAFPTTTLFLVMRRRLSPLLGLGEDKETEKHELEGLQCVNTSIAEAFSDVGVTTLTQLAYEDPIQLAMRTNLPFYFVLDLVSQALAAIYLDLAKARKYSIRGALEAAVIKDNFAQGSGPEFDKANAIVAALASDLGMSEAALLANLEQISCDPCTMFLAAIW
jgi:hypothetical protein